MIIIRKPPKTADYILNLEQNCTNAKIILIDSYSQNNLTSLEDCKFVYFL